jgi:hypothetical protein
MGRSELRRIERLVGREPRPRQVTGVEHELRVLGPTGIVDFRSLLHELPVDGARLDPGDPNAYRCSWGGVLTADGREAEIATPPFAVEPGFSERVLASIEAGRRALEAMLPPDHTLQGYSTHLNVQVSDRVVVRAARRFVDRFAPAMMLLLDGPSSPGLLVRPRRGRLELGGEYLAGDPLRASLVFAAGAARCCARPLRIGSLPPVVRADAEPAVERFGWYVDRCAFGVDLYEHGRGAPLRRRDGRPWLAQQQLEAAWSVARRAIAQDASTEELELVDRVVDGTARLPLEQP